MGISDTKNSGARDGVTCDQLDLFPPTPPTAHSLGYPGLPLGVVVQPTLTLPTQAFGFWLLIFPSEYLMAARMGREWQLALPAPCSPSSAGYLMRARSGVLQSQTQMRNIPCYHLISCGRWSGMCKRGDGESCRANERVRKVGDGAGKGRGERVLVLRFQVISPRGGHNRAEPKDYDCWGYKNS